MQRPCNRSSGMQPIWPAVQASQIRQTSHSRQDTKIDRCLPCQLLAASRSLRCMPATAMYHVLKLDRARVAGAAPRVYSSVGMMLTSRIVLVAAAVATADAQRVIQAENAVGVVEAHATVGSGERSLAPHANIFVGRGAAS
jgi:fructose-specific phosphotransferase system IIC component